MPLFNKIYLLYWEQLKAEIPSMENAKLLTSLTPGELEYYQKLLYEANIESTIRSSALENNMHLYENNFKEYYLIVSKEDETRAFEILNINSSEDTEIEYPSEDTEIEYPVEPNYIRKAFYATAIGLGIPFAGTILSFYYLYLIKDKPKHRTKIVLITVMNIFEICIQVIYIYL